MKVVFEKNDLVTALRRVAVAIPSKTTKPVLMCARLSAGEDAWIDATNLEHVLRQTVACIVHEPGEALLPVDQLRSIIAPLRSEMVEVHSTANGIKVLTADAQFELPTPDPQEYPPPKKVEAETWWQIPADIWPKITILNRVASSADNARYVMGGVRIEAESTTLRLIATDGRRMAIVNKQTTMTPEEDASQKLAATVPIESVKVLTCLKEELFPAEVSITSDGQLIFRAGNATVWVMPLEGRYPDWRTIAEDKKIQWQAKVSAIQLRSAVQAIVGMNRDNYLPPHVCLRFDPGRLLVGGQWSDYGRGKIVVPAQYDGERVVVALNGQFLIDAIAGLDEDTEWWIGGSHPENPVWVEQEDGSYQHIVMPVEQRYANWIVEEDGTEEGTENEEPLVLNPANVI